VEEVLLVAGMGGTASLTPRPPPRWRVVSGLSLPFSFPQCYSLDGGHILPQVGVHTPLRTLSAFLLCSTPAVKHCSLPSAIAFFMLEREVPCFGPANILGLEIKEPPREWNHRMSDRGNNNMLQNGCKGFQMRFAAHYNSNVT